LAFHCLVLQWRLDSEVGSYRNTKKNGGGDRLKFIGFWEYDLKDADEVVEKFRRAMAERAAGKREDFPKLIYGPFHIGGESKGFAIYETDNMEAITNMTVYYTPVLKMKFLPIHESTRVAELYLQSKKSGIAEIRL